MTRQAVRTRLLFKRSNDVEKVCILDFLRVTSKVERFEIILAEVTRPWAPTAKVKF